MYLCCWPGKCLWTTSAVSCWVPRSAQIYLCTSWTLEKGTLGLRLSTLGGSLASCHASCFQGVLRVCRVQFWVQITIIWKDIKWECFREITPSFWTSPLSGVLYLDGMSNHFSSLTFSICSSSSFRKLLKLCTTLGCILPCVPVIHVTHVHCILFFLLSIPKWHSSKIVQYFNQMEKEVEMCQLFGRQNKEVFCLLYSSLPLPCTSHWFLVQEWSFYREG